MNIKVKYEYLLGIIALLWVLFFAFTIQLKPEISTLGDDGSYLFSARLLYFQHQIDNTRPVLISALHGLPYFFNFNDSFVINWGLFINFITWFFTSIVIFKISSKILNRSKAFYLAFLFQLCIGNLAHAFNFLSESVFIFLILLSVYFMQLFFETKKQHYISIALSIVLLNTLIKPVSIGFALIIMFFFIKKTINILFNKYSFILLFSISLLIFQMYSLNEIMAILL